MKNEKIAYFNLLKFIAAITIAIFLHYGDHLIHLLKMPNPFPHNGFLEYITKNSYVFVEMFFMISGILFKIAYQKRIVNGESFKKFIKNRIIRIYPLLIVTTLYMYFINYVIFRFNRTFWEGGTLSLWNLFSDLVFAGKPIFNANNTLNGTIWYLNVLMVCYLIAYILTKLYKKYNTNYIYVIPVILGLMIRYSNFSFLFWNISIARGLMSFFIGILIGVFFEKFDKMNIKKRRKIKIVLLFELSIFFFLLTRKTGNLYVEDNILSYTFLVFPELIILLYDNKILNKICSTKVVDYLGNISFGIYLWNFPVLSTWFILIINKIVKINVLSKTFFIYNFIIHIVVAIISYHIIDKRLISLIKNKRG